MAAALRTVAQLWGAIGLANDTANFSLNDPLAQTERLVCDVWAQNPSALSLNPTAVAEGYNSRCKPYYDELGVDAPQSEPPNFTGGQCSGPYTLTFVGNPGANRVVGSNIPGPFSDFQQERVSRGVSLGNERFDYNVSIVDGNGVTRSFTFSNVLGSDWVYSPDFQRPGGLPDDCGDPAPGPPAPVPNYPRPPTFNPDGTVTPDPSTGDTTVNIETKVDIDGDEYIEVTGPGFEYVRSPGFSEPRLPGDRPEATDGAPSQPTGDGGEVADDLTPEEEEQGLETIGYAWSLSNYPSNAGIVQNTNPDVFFTPLGNVQLVYDVNGNNRFSDNLPIRAASGTIIRDDASLKVRAVRFNKRPDVSGITLTPIRRVRVDAS